MQVIYFRKSQQINLSQKLAYYFVPQKKNAILGICTWMSLFVQIHCQNCIICWNGGNIFWMDMHSIIPYQIEFFSYHVRNWLFQQILAQFFYIDKRFATTRFWNLDRSIIEVSGKDWILKSLNDKKIKVSGYRPSSIVSFGVQFRTKIFLAKIKFS